ncbi:aminoglycoside phosphotransferase family protein [Kribbella sp. NPDC048915]|uniref:aminoglycoside phosphotransferase family protein n=1 Tax=Kribbella sp. NPDC048915 TaxID=3155148 RepID=UPI003401ABFD
MIPEAFVRTTVEREGAAGEAWLAELPAIVDELVQRWNLEREGPWLHGQVGVIVPVRGSGERPAVLKVSFPHPGNVHEPDAFDAWDGRCAVELYERDDARYALLLERVHTTSLAEYSGDRAPIAGNLLRQLAIPAPNGLPRMSERAGEWAEQLRKDAAELDHPLPSAVVDAALGVVEDHCREQPETLIHGDFHALNILRADREPWLVVDPKGYVGDPAYDAAFFLRTRAYYLHLGGRALDDLLSTVETELHQFAEASGIEADHIRRWTHLIIVQSAFWARRHGFGRARTGDHLDELITLVDKIATTWTA